MCTHPSTAPDPVERFWDRYLELLLKQGVKESAQRWYVLRAEHYIKTFPDKKLARHTAQDITGYLEKMGRCGDLLDWQFRQAVDAIRNLFLIITNRWEKEIDWQYWQDSAQTLPPDHRTIAREKPPGRRAALKTWIYSPRGNVMTIYTPRSLPRHAGVIIPSALNKLMPPGLCSLPRFTGSVRSASWAVTTLFCFWNIWRHNGMCPPAPRTRH